MFKLSIFTLVLFSLSLLQTSIVSAQLVPISIDGIDFVMNPENPRPRDTVNIKAESFNIDIPSSSFTWSINGKVYKQGIGEYSINVIAPDIGNVLTIRVQTQDPQGKTIQKNNEIKPSTVDIIWESQSYKPPFYNGKNNISYEDTVRLVAIPQISRGGTSLIDPKTLVYRWKMGGKDIDGGVGYGVQSVVVPMGNIPKDAEIRVDVTTRDGSVEASAVTTITPVAPSVTFYEESQLYGPLFNRALINRVPLRNSEMRIKAVPFGFTVNKNRNDLNYVWSINNVDQDDLVGNQSITVRSKGEVEGSSFISLRMRNIEQILQGAENSVTVYYSKKTSNPEVTEPIF